MKILVVGANGTIGKLVIEELAPRHEIIAAGKNRGQHRMDVTQEQSLRESFEKIGKVDAIIAAAGGAYWGPLKDMSSEQFRIGLNDKLMGQVNLTLIGQRYLNDGGSITLTSGGLSHDPQLGAASISAVNSAIDGFVRGAAIELERGCRINSVSPSVLKESWDKYAAGFPGTEPVSGRLVALAYRKSVEGKQTGQTFRVW